MCLAIPGRVIAIGPEPHLGTVDVCGVRRTVNIDLLSGEGLAVDDWVLIHVGFAMSRISDGEAREQLKLLSLLGEDRQAIEELEGYQF